MCAQALQDKVPDLDEFYKVLHDDDDITHAVHYSLIQAKGSHDWPGTIPDLMKRLQEASKAEGKNRAEKKLNETKERLRKEHFKEEAPAIKEEQDDDDDDMEEEEVT